MNIDSYFQETMEETRPEPEKKWDSNLAVTKTVPDTATGCFDCNICLDFAQDPVVTLCGHLYCWPCIYKWITLEKTSTPQQCPVCKATLSKTTLVPLYGRGQPPKPEGKVSLPKLHIPQRPPANRPDPLSSPSNHHNHTHHHVHQHQHFHQDYSPYNGHYLSSPSMSFRVPVSPTAATAGALAEMAISLLPWLFGCPGAGIFSSSSAQHQPLVPLSPSIMNSPRVDLLNSPRLRRQEIQAERSLSRIWAFLLCGCLLCLVFF